jgi:hypothetical protein
MRRTDFQVTIGEATLAAEARTEDNECAAADGPHAAQPRILFLDQNAWIALAQGSWDRTVYPRQHAALTLLAEAMQAGRVIVPLSFANIYETHKINDPVRRGHLARVQVTISRGLVFRSRRHIFERLLVRHLSDRLGRQTEPLARDWFLSAFFFEAAADYSPSTFGCEIPTQVLDFIRRNPQIALFDYLSASDEAVRLEAVRRYSADSAGLLKAIETRRKLAAAEGFALRRRAYSAQLLIDEVDLVLKVARELNPQWLTVRDLGAQLSKSLVSDIPIMNVERELAVRLEDQARAITENDLRDMISFSVALPLSDVLIAEKPFVALARQARLGDKYQTTLLTDIAQLAARHFE